VLNEDGAATCPIFTGPISAGPIVAGDHSVRVVALAPARFAAAVGIVNREPVG
jgi:hypothetical protein